MTRLARTALALCALAACSSSPDELTDAGLFCEVSTGGSSSYPRTVDVLFVIDTSPEMQSHADGLAFNLPRFANVMQTIEGGMPGVHVGFATADGGALVATPNSAACSAPDDAYLIDDRLPWFQCSESFGTPCGPRNYDGAFEDALPCLAPVPGAEPVAREPLAAALRALDGSISGNAGFDRSSVPLLIVFIAAGDDASAAPPESYAAQLRALSDDGIGPLVSIVAPPGSPRLQAFADAFPQRAAYADITREDWTDALVLLAELFWRPPSVTCLAGVDTTDLDPTEPGLQLECSVVASGVIETVLPACVMLAPDRPDPATPLPCWWIYDRGEANGPGCPYSPVVEHPAYPAIGAATVRCVGTCE